MSKQTILIICNNNLDKAPRFQMEVDALHADYNIIACGISDITSKKYSFIPLFKPSEKQNRNITFHLNYPFFLRKLFSVAIRLFYYKFLNSSKKELIAHRNELMKHPFDLLIVHHLDELPLAVELARRKKVKLVFNAHEYYPLEFNDDEFWMKNEHPKRVHIAKEYFKSVDACFCVGKIIADKYKEEFNLNSIVITNSKPFYNLIPGSLGKGQKIKLIHHGAAISARKIELMIDMMDYLGEDYHLTLILMLSGDKNYFDWIKKKAEEHPSVSLVNPVSISEIPKAINKYDIGLFILPPTNFNYTYALPNKFFEFVQARLGIAISPSPEMAELVNKYDLGVVADDFSPQSMAKKIKELSIEKIMYHKNQSHTYAMDLSVEKNELLIKQTVDNLLN